MTRGSLRARFGYAMDRALFYVTGGYTGANMRGSLADTGGNPSLFFNQSNYLNGYVVGLGLEYAVTNNVSVKAEYLYRTLEDQSIFGGAHLTNAGLHESLVRGGV